MQPFVIVSNGHFKFHLAPLAAELASKDHLDQFLTGAYPSDAITLQSLTRILSKYFAAVRRFEDRREKGIPRRKIRAQNLSEVLLRISTLLRISRLHSVSEWFHVRALDIYSAGAKIDVGNSKANIYHYRAGYGGVSVDQARSLGMLCICDHSIVNPEVLDYLVENRGQWPEDIQHVKALAPFWAKILHDIKRADVVIVNSAFVKESFVRFGWDSRRMFVQYWGVDDSFIAAIPARPVVTGIQQRRFLFAGDFSKRKGAEYLTEALQKITKDFKLDICAAINPDSLQAANQLKSDSRVNFHGIVSRSSLARFMSAADVFVFPSLAEGSARVVFEALAAGCFVITTHNSGSIVEDGVHGRIVRPGNVADLVDAINFAINQPHDVGEIGKRNAITVGEIYTQSLYAQGIESIYSSALKLYGK